VADCALAFAISAIGFTLLYIVIEGWLDWKSPTGTSRFFRIYRMWIAQKKADFLSRVNSNIHAFVAICFGFYALFLKWYDEAPDPVQS